MSETKRQAAMFARASLSSKGSFPGFLIMNADDWGFDHLTTDRILECADRGAISSVSAMVFMDDSDRAATLARERGLEAGLHLNLTTPFSARRCQSKLVACQQELARYLLKHRLSQVVFHPGLTNSFEYVVAAQLEEFRRLYGADPERLDGHHHMHLCSNVLLGGLLPQGTLVRRNFSFQSGEKSLVNWLYRRLVDGILGRHHRLVDYFFSLVPFEHPSRLEGIFSLARRSVVEVETHPANFAEYQFLLGGKLFQHTRNLRIAPPSSIRTTASIGK